MADRKAQGHMSVRPIAFKPEGKGAPTYTYMLLVI